MLGKLIQRWQRRITSAEIADQVEEELCFHREMLACEYEERGLTKEAAEVAAERRFGNVERVKSECVEIRRRNRPAVKLLKLCLLLFFVAGVWLRAKGLDIRFTQLGHLLMATAVLGQLLLYVRGLRAAGSLPPGRNPRLSILGQGERSYIKAYDEHGRTPVERLVADKANKGP